MAGLSPIQRLTPAQQKIAIAVAALVAAVIAGFLLFGRGNFELDKLSGDQVSAADGTVPANPAAACASGRTYDELRRELFRKAAALRGRDEAVFDQIARNAMLIVDQPRLVERDEAIGQLRCAGTITIALPPGLTTGNGQSRLRGAAEYGVQQAADGSGPTVTLIGGDAVTAALATLVRSGAPATPQAPPPVLLPASDDPELPPPPESAPPPPPGSAAPPPVVQRPSARPSFNCAFARTRGERAVCGNGELAALDRQMASRYVAAMRRAGPREARQLQSTRDRFLAFRDRCGSDRCIADAYRGRMREIDDIIGGDWRP